MKKITQLVFAAVAIGALAGCVQPAQAQGYYYSETYYGPAYVPQVIYATPGFAVYSNYYVPPPAPVYYRPYYAPRPVVWKKDRHWNNEGPRHGHGNGHGNGHHKH
jgi:hypothetical protein